MAIQNESAFDATRQFIEDAFPAVSEKARALSYTAEELVREGDQFVRREVTQTFVDLGSALEEELHALPSFAAAVKELRADEQLGPKFEAGIAGTIFWSFPLTPEDTLDKLLIEALVDGTEVRPAPERIAEAYESVERDLYADEVQFFVVAPLPGLTIAELPLELDSGIAIDRLTDDEVVRSLRAGLLQPVGGYGLLHVGELAGVRITRTLPKLVVRHDEEEGEGERPHGEAQRLFAEFSGIVERVVQGVRLVKSGPFGAPGYIYYGADERRAQATGWVPLSTSLTVRFARQTFDAGESGALCVLWAGLRSDEVRGHKALQTALRRFGYAGDRDRADDGLVDLLIAAEALFLPRESQELGYKLAMRAAFFLKDQGFAVLSTFTHMKRAYSARSQIVHGATLSDLKLPDGTHVTLDKFVNHTEALLRAAVAKAIHVVSGAEGGSLDDLDHLILVE